MEENDKIKCCENCGEKLNPEDKYCGACGTKVLVDEKTSDVGEMISGIDLASYVQEESEDNSENLENDETLTDEVETPADTQEVPVDEDNNESTDTNPSQPVYQNNETRKEKTRKGVPLWGCVVITLSGVLLSVVVTVVVLLYWQLPISKTSVLGRMITAYAGGNTTIGGQVIQSGSDVTINISGESTNLAAAVYAKCAQSVCGVGVLQSSSASLWSDTTLTFVGTGSGVVYKEDGYIITNHHVVSSAIDETTGQFASGYIVRVYFEESLSVFYNATLIGYDQTSDLAVLKINVTGLKPIEFEDSDNISLGDECFAIGSPGGLSFLNSISNGIISGINRTLSTDTGYAYDLIQTNTAINPGNSGGALLSRVGKLIGICEMKIVSDGFEGMGFAISSNTAKKICDTIISNGNVVRPALGISVNTVYDKSQAVEYGLPAGAWVVGVTEGSAADRAGVTTNMIITKFNGVAVGGYFELRRELQKCIVGDVVTIEVYDFSKTGNQNNGEYREITITLQVLTEE